MRGTISAALVAVMAAAGCMDETPGDHGELALELSSNAQAEAYRVVVTTSTGMLVLDRKIEPNRVVMPIDSRFVAALPAGQLLLVQVLALDANGSEVGAGATFVRLVAAQLTEVQIDVVAYQTGGSAGILGATISEAALPTREYLFPDPADAAAGDMQRLGARLSDARTGTAVTDVVAVSLAGAVAPMFLPTQDGGVSAEWTWAQPPAFPAKAAAELAYLDAAGRGWIARAAVDFEAADTRAPVAFDWFGQVHLSGIVMPVDSRWLMSRLASSLRLQADADGDGTFSGAGETKLFPIGQNARPIVFETTEPTQIIMPIDIAGAIFDQDGDGKLDTIATISQQGAIASVPWPLGK